jgi:hypothetical protein
MATTLPALRKAIALDEKATRDARKASRAMHKAHKAWLARWEANERAREKLAGERLVFLSVMGTELVEAGEEAFRDECAARRNARLRAKRRTDSETAHYNG